MITRILVFPLILCLVSGFPGNPSLADTQPQRLIHVGDVFPDESLDAPKDRKDVEYLGLGVTDKFKIGDIKAELVLVELLSIYCMTCQMQAPLFNKLHELIEADPVTRGRIKIVGIGVGNAQMHLDHFRDQFNVPFPLFPDPEMKIHQAVGEGRTPFTIFVRLDRPARKGVVARTHLGAHEDSQILFDDMRALMTLDLAVIERKGRTTKPKYVTVKPLMTESELRARVKVVMEKSYQPVSNFIEVALKGFGPVYTATIQLKGEKKRIFAEVIGRPPTCDVCHDVHFFYIFDDKGKILDFIPLQLTKYDNEPWEKEDVEQMRSHLLKRTVFSPLSFNPDVDAISSATITSLIIFDSMSRSVNLYRQLKTKGLIE